MTISSAVLARNVIREGPALVQPVNMLKTISKHTLGLQLN